MTAQIIIRPNYGSTTVVNMGDLTNISIENTLPASVNVRININIENNKEGLLASSVSNTLTLNPGPNLFSNELLNISRFSYSLSALAKKLSATQIFETGEYKVCYQVINLNDNGSIGDHCTNFTITNTNSSSDTTSKKKAVTIHGTSEILFNYSSSQANYTNLPPTYLNWTFSPQVTVLDVPFSARLFLTTMQLPGQQSMNNFSFSFDANQFKNILKTKLMEYIKKNKTLAKFSNLNVDSYMSQFNDIQNIFSNPAVMDEIKKLGELDSLKNMVNNYKDVTNSVKNQYEEVKDQYGELKQNYQEVKNSITGDSTQVKTDSTSLSLNTDSLLNDSTISRLKDKSALVKDSLGRIKNSIIIVKDSLLDEKDKYMDKADSVKNKVNAFVSDPSQLGTAALDSAKSRIKELEWLESKRKYYDELMAKKDKLTDLGKKWGLLDSSGNPGSIDKIKDINVDNLSDPAYLYSKLKSSNLLRKFDKILYSVKSLSFGLSTPQYSNFSLQGMAINGFSIELEPFKVYAGFTYGSVMNPVLTSNTQFASYKRMLYAGKFGYGSKEKSHIHVTILSSTDDSTSVNPRDSLYLIGKMPQDNKVISIDGQINLFNNKLILSAEFAGSQTVKDLTSVTNNILNPASQTSPENWFINIFSQNKNVNKAVVDYAVFAKVEANLFKNKTKISANFKRIGPHFYSFGLPFLIRDMMTFEVKLSQSIWKNRLQLSAFIRRNEDNLEHTKLQTTQSYNWGFDFNLKIPKWPTIKAGLTPMTLQSDTSYFNMIALTFNSNYSFRIRKVQNISSLSFIKQMSDANDTNLYFDITYVTFLHSLQLKNGISFNINSSYINSNSNNTQKDTWIIGAGGSGTLFKIWNNLLGGNFYINQNETKWGAYWQTSLTVTKYLTFSLRLENNQFNTYLNLPGVNNYTQFTCRTSMIAKW